MSCVALIIKYQEKSAPITCVRICTNTTLMCKIIWGGNWEYLMAMFWVNEFHFNQNLNNLDFIPNNKLKNICTNKFKIIPMSILRKIQFYLNLWLKLTIQIEIKFKNYSYLNKIRIKSGQTCDRIWIKWPLSHIKRDSIS